MWVHVVASLCSPVFHCVLEATQAAELETGAIFLSLISLFSRWTQHRTPTTVWK